MYYEQPRKEPFGVRDIMWSLFRNAIATLPSQNNGKLQAYVIKFLIYYTVSILYSRTQANFNFLRDTVDSG